MIATTEATTMVGAVAKMRFFQNHTNELNGELDELDDNARGLVAALGDLERIVGAV